MLGGGYEQNDEKNRFVTYPHVVIYFAIRRNLCF